MAQRRSCRREFEVSWIRGSARRNRPFEGGFAYGAGAGVWVQEELGWRGEERCRAGGTGGGDQDGCRQVLGVMERAKEDAESWRCDVVILKR